MSGNFGCQFWITYAGDDKEAWKCIGLARSVKRTLSTRPLGVILSDNVSLDMGRRLQSEFQICHRIDPLLLQLNGIPYQFRSTAKIYAQQLPQLDHSVFIDCNCLALKNCDELFRQNGVQWVKQTGSEYAAIVVQSSTVTKENKKTNIEKIVSRENGLKVATPSMIDVDDQEFHYCMEVDFSGETPTQLSGDEIKMVCFVNENHPLEYEREKANNRDGFLKELARFWKSLLPENFATSRKLPLSALDSGDQILFDQPPFELNNSIAIVGMACKYPGANTISEFWELLENGTDCIVRVPEWRWTKENSYIVMDDVRKTEAGFLSCPIEVFDAKFFNTNQADLAYLDPQQRIALKVVWEALEHARIDPATLKNSLTGVFGGFWRGDYKEMLQHQGFAGTDFLRGYMGNALGPLTARIAHFLELIGPCFSTESGCSTSIAGVDMACEALKNERADVCIAVGVNLLLHPFPLIGGLIEGVLAPDGRCKTFDASANGFGRAEGAASLILKRYSDAVAHGDRIWGLIRGTAVVQEGISKNMGTPTVDVEATAMALALQRAAVDPEDVDFLEAHGTGTEVGDPIEVAAIARVYGGRKSDNPLTIASVKTQIGHTESVCGIASIQKTVLSMKYEKIPKHLHLKVLNPDIDLSKIPARIPTEIIPWLKRTSKPRIAGVNSFGITGAQAHVIIQEPPEPSPTKPITLADNRSMKILTFSGKTEKALQAQLEAYRNLLPTTDADLGDVEYTMHMGRSHFAFRQVALGSTSEEVLTSIENIKSFNSIPNLAPKICFLFTGQGSQYLGMCKALYDDSVVFRSNFDKLDSILQKEHNIEIKEIIWNSNLETSSIHSTLFSQTSIFCVEICILRLWESWGVKPDAVLGHSLGEFAALVAAGMMCVEDALKLVVTRSKLIDELPRGGMLVVGSEIEQVQKALDQAGLGKGNPNGLEIAAVNSVTQTVVAGDLVLVKKFKLFCDNNCIKTHVLDSTHAFHSRHMDPILEEYGRVAADMKFKESNSNVIFVSAVEGKIIQRIDVNYLIKHTRENVKFMEASHAVVKDGLGLFVENGPQPILSSLLASNSEEISDNIILLPSVRRNESNWVTILDSMGKLYKEGIPIKWENFHRFTSATKIDLPGYVFDESPHWIKIKDDGTVPFHPLLGSYIPNASDVTIFQSSVNVNRVQFLRDHRLGEKIIFPCAGYLDMCLTAGYAALQCDEGKYRKPTTSLAIQNFSIASPICMSEMHSTEFQVVVSKTLEGETTVKVNSRLFLEPSKYKWINNARARFVINSTSPENHLTNFHGLKSRICEPINESFDYEKLKEYGFNFGPSMHTICNQSWKNPEADSGEYIFSFKCNETVEYLDKFILHPWVIDATFQAQILGMTMRRDKYMIKGQLIVPIQIEKFIWWGGSCSSGYIYSKHLDGCNEARIYSEEGILIATVLGTEFMETTLNNIMAMIDSQKNPLPTITEYVWKEHLGTRERRVVVDGEDAKLQNIVGPVEPVHLTPDEGTVYNNYAKHGGLCMLKAMKELGLDQYQQFMWPEIAQTLKVSQNLHKFLRYILLELVTDGYLVLDPDQNRDASVLHFSLSLTLPFPTLEKICSDISTSTETCQTVNYTWTSTMSELCKFWAVLSDILTGRQQALQLLFESNSNLPDERCLADMFYANSFFKHTTDNLVSIGSRILERFPSMGVKPMARVLEVGAGVGGCTELAIVGMKNGGVSSYEYTYTDLSPVFLQRGATIFQDTGISTKFEILDIEKDPLQQGFVPQYYDAVHIGFVLHATKNIEESLLNVKTLLRPGGYVFLFELVGQSRDVNLTFGGLEGFWRFEDIHLRPWNCELDQYAWRTLLEKHGFIDCTIVLTPYGACEIIAQLSLDSESHCEQLSVLPRRITRQPNCWLLFGGQDSITQGVKHKFELNGFETKIILLEDVKSTGHDMEEDIANLFSSCTSDISGIIYMWSLDPTVTTKNTCEPFLYICKQLLQITNFQVLVVTNGCMNIGATDYYQNTPTASPIVGMLQVLANENMEIKCKSLDIDDGEFVVDEIFSEVFSGNIDTLVAYRNNKRYTPRLKKVNMKKCPLDVPPTPNTRLIAPPTNLISDLYFAPFETLQLTEGQVEVEIRAYALNFLDVLMATKPDPIFTTYNTLGMDITGVVTALGPKCSERKIGDRVIVIRRSGDSLPSRIASTEELTIPIPSDMTFNDAATLPIASLTVYYSLVHLAKARKEDVILIHTASGGVGLVAIQVAKQIGCTIIVTAGNLRKRNYLKSLGLKYIFNSRSTKYEHDIRQALGGNMVTIVLNSITGEGFKEATLSVCREGAKFVEMSKMNIWSKKEVHLIRPDVIYNNIDVSILPEDELKMLNKELHTLMQGGFKDGNKRPTPLPYTSFESKHIRNALEYVEKAKHIGKVVITMPELDKGSNQYKYRLFNKEATYLITGGLGGIGLEVAKWMSEVGAKNVLLVGRSAPKSEALRTIELLKQKGVSVNFRQVDIGNFHEVKNLFNEFVPENGMYHIRGIMHAAGVLEDGTLENQNWDKFEKVYQSKIQGGWNLHKISAELKFPLEHFVVFSSMATTFGAAGQSNYASANYYLDALVHYRHSLGLPGLTINWGQWGQVGLAANISNSVYKPFTVHQGISALEYAMKSHNSHLQAFEADLGTIKKLVPSARGLLADIEVTTCLDTENIDEEEFWMQYDSCTGRSQKLDVLKKCITSVIRGTLKMNKDDLIDENTSFQDLGLDSLMLVEMKNSLQTSIGKRVKISLHAVKDCKSIVELSNRLVELISGEDDLVDLTTSELLELAEEDAHLPDDIQVDELVINTLRPVSRISTVLITGSTGTLGPYILRELRENYPFVEKIYCLMRPNSFLSHEDRFNRMMQGKNLISQTHLDGWVEAIPGDVGKDMMGLNSTMYAKLCEEVDAVINLAVKVSYQEKYNASKNIGSCRIINVQGFKNVLEFAVSKKLKHVFYSSTTGAQTDLGEDGLYSETWSTLDEIQYIPNSAYLISKRICEVLASQAIERGIPCKVFRITNIGGDSEVGGNIQLDNFLMIRFLAYMYLGFMPAHNVPLCMLPVDLCAEFSMKLFFNEEAPSGLYNILNPDLDDEREFDEVALELGVTVDVLEPDEFFGRLKSMDDSDPMHEFIKQIIEYQIYVDKVEERPPGFYLPWLQGKKNITWSKKLAQFIPDVYPSKIMSSWDVLKKDLATAKRNGIFDRYRIRYSSCT
ncbi:phenolphthiocerol synthesis polyketide synthase type I Pks15/1 isoform X2 [Folsomia candida]|uniref:phenolphthiocerol synthesis polyketide synthase type I Pks15/1 isoform X2 n=1 Tax=Folsomia candida TaxID=158441 RepID=UPI001604F4A4|nr:phenolphthiocerol synthesis polyketide synthase type I Pks15/1 isoform X2 [Folsomia candida]